MSSALSHVLATPELLESSLIHLPLQELLQAQLISRHLNALIRTSPRLLQLLFQWAEQPNPDWRLNPLLSQHFPSFFFIDNYDIACGTNKTSFRFMKWTLNSSSRTAFLRKEASWRNMFIVQPPPASLLVSRGTYHVDPKTGSYREYDGTYEEPGEEVAIVAFETGVNMGKIYDIVTSFLVRNPCGVFRLAFDSRHDGVRIVLRLYSLISNNTDEEEPDGEVYESEGKQIGVDDLEWKQVVQDRLDDEHRLSELYKTWGCDLTEEKGGTEEQEWWKEAHRARIREFMAQRAAPAGRG